MSESYQLSSAEIAKRAKSNLAIALSCLPKERREDMISFYAFCRIADDIADNLETPADEKKRQLDDLRKIVTNGEAVGNPVLDEVVQLSPKYGFPRAWLGEIVDGVATDLDQVRYETLDDLLAYCYKVACVVGLVSIEIFGHRHPDTKNYAVNLGYALQITNIMRDVGEDAAEGGRIYLPLEDLERFGVTEKEILEGRHSDRFVRLMDAQYGRAKQFYQQANESLPTVDKPFMLPSEMMAKIYSEILHKLKRTGYPVFSGRCRLHPMRKAAILTTYMLRGWIARF